MVTLPEIEEFLLTNGISSSAFGLALSGSSGYLSDIRSGYRKISPDAAHKIAYLLTDPGEVIRLSAAVRAARNVGKRSIPRSAASHAVSRPAPKPMQIVEVIHRDPCGRCGVRADLHSQFGCRQQHDKIAVRERFY